MRNHIFHIVLFGIFIIPLKLISQTTEFFSVPGSYLWTVPPCVTSLTVQVWGGGGGGGGTIGIINTASSDGINSREVCVGAGGGAGGGYTSRTFAVTPGQVYNIVVGAGGTAGPAGSGTWNGGISTPAGPGGTGQTSSFIGNGINLQATGGSGGGGASGYNTSGYTCLRVEGTAGLMGGTGSGGTVNFTGGTGAVGYILSHSTDKSGGGGGAAGPGGNGGNAPHPNTVGVAAPPGGTGNAPGGNGGVGRMTNVPGILASNGADGQVIGGGGGGSLVHRDPYDVSAASGGVGGRGEVRITYTGVTPPSLMVSAPQICSGESVTISASGTFSSFNWNTGQTGSSIVVSPVSSSTYVVTGLDASGCNVDNSTNIEVLPAPSVTPSVSSASICAGQSVNLAANPTINSTTVTYDFESTTNPFTLSNGSHNNWYRGTAASCNGSGGLYIGTASGNNNYVTATTSTTWWGGTSTTERPIVSFAYRDIPITACNAELSFNWRCLGKSTDYLSVWVVPTTQTLTGGTLANELTVGGQRLKIGGDYWNSPTNCNNVTLNLIQGWVTEGQTIRLVFQWRNTGTNPNSAQNPAAMIDDVIITQYDGYSYSWSSTNTTFSSTNLNGSESPTTSTTYNLLTTDCYGCTRSSALSVVVDPCPMPIELISLSGQCENREKQFNWSTATEHNNDYFTLQHSKNGNEFYPIQIIDGAGNSTNQLNYSTNFTEEDDSFEYYRLKQTDTDGVSSYSDVIYVSCHESENDLINVFPNPSNDLIVVSFNALISENDYLISISDMVGKTVLDKHVALVKNGNTVLDISSFSKGYYFLNLIDKKTGEKLDVVRFSKID